jgi:hypothetical protein
MYPALYLPNGSKHAPARVLMDKLFVELHSDVFGKKIHGGVIPLFTMNFK